MKTSNLSSKVVAAGIAAALLLSATPALAQTAQNEPFRPQLALFEGISSWFNKVKNAVLAPQNPTTSVFVVPASQKIEKTEEDTLQNLYHGQNILNRLQDKYTDLKQTADQLSTQMDAYAERGFDTSKVKVFTDLAQDKLAVAQYDIGIATSTMIMVPSEEQSANEDIRTTLKAADESVRTASQAVVQAKTKVRDFSLKIRKESR